MTGFEEALRGRDIARAAGMFCATSFWRDLVSFTWNITTVENPAGVAELLTGTLDGTDPTSFAVEEPPDEVDGVTTVWFTFQTAVGRGRGMARLVEEAGETKAWTFLTSLQELKGYEEPRGARRPMGAEHGINKQRLPQAKKKRYTIALVATPRLAMEPPEPADKPAAVVPFARPGLFIVEVSSPGAVNGGRRHCPFLASAFSRH